MFDLAKLLKFPLAYFEYPEFPNANLVLFLGFPIESVAN